VFTRVRLIFQLLILENPLGSLMRWFPLAFRILCRWPEVDSSAFRGDFSPQGQEGALDLYPLIHPQKRLLALGGGGPFLPVVIRSVDAV
jgi:hypothetical protein